MKLVFHFLGKKAYSVFLVFGRIVHCNISQLYQCVCVGGIIGEFCDTDKGGYISDLKPRLGSSDFEAMFILGRSTMNFIDLCGKHTCYAAEYAAEERLLKAIGFSKDENGRYFVDMTGFFDGHCSGHPVDLNK